MAIDEQNVKWVCFAPEGVYVSIPAQKSGIEYDAVEEVPEDRGCDPEAEIQPTREVIQFKFVAAGSPLNPPAKLLVRYTPADWKKKSGDELRLCKWVGGTWVDAADPAAFDNFLLVPDKANPAMGGFGLVYIHDTQDPRVAWY
jgi:hypothetical protein